MTTCDGPGRERSVRKREQVSNLIVVGLLGLGFMAGVVVPYAFHLVALVLRHCGGM